MATFVEREVKILIKNKKKFYLIDLCLKIMRMYAVKVKGHNQC